MQLVTDTTHFQSPKESTLTIGTFDGIHIGHQRIIAQVVDTARQRHLIPTVLTFFPHPRMVLNPSAPIALIQTIEERANLLEKYGIEQLVIQPFDKEFASLTAEDYVKEVLVKKLKAKVIIIGYDHRFGKNRSAGIEELKAFGEQYHFEVIEIPVQEVDSLSVSSTKIRNALNQGNIEQATHYLGYPFSLSGKVVHGQKIGRTLGYPTANIQVANTHKLIPKIGVYAVYSIIEGEKIYGMLSIGKNPTIEGKGESIEVYFFDFDKDLYEKEIRVYFVAFLREEVKFHSLEALKTQLKMDESIARQYFV
ncbi:bifunctional riboflavin kinase/FAD synthetase [Capnocytophaga sp. G2]|uniref:bifunctional riboflavin kinase/FAD synthetase n=1 Tax=Capnocytophaga sp. G2 TaxID=3110695 RepID=UPI002B488A79|nr:bifunctional riboflavin kinase/FAD synthetase [Capnocytophaga sp. G2]MEB3003816.1 bifunctional riboflavin kinase/FAD synthetase [Capnocytophaga sp. G2]